MLMVSDQLEARGVSAHSSTLSNELPSKIGTDKRMREDITEIARKCVGAVAYCIGKIHFFVV